MGANTKQSIKTRVYRFVQPSVVVCTAPLSTLLRWWPYLWSGLMFNNKRLLINRDQTQLTLCAEVLDHGDLTKQYCQG